MHKPPSKGINSYVADVYVQRGRQYREERPVILPIPTYPHVCADQLWFGAASGLRRHKPMAGIKIFSQE